MNKISMALLMALGVLAALPAQAGMLGRFEVVEDRARVADASAKARDSILWSLDTTSGAVSACTATKAACKTESEMWGKGEEGKQRYRIASHEIDGEPQLAELWVIDTTTGTIQRCQTDLAPEPNLVCAKSR
ncbi:hypothetical protein [Hypericibacter sp.]|uniref:hypothetical protein n=1 Tax=Hypericibacter sp. TaxID=2705401 RepID=UPI003D6D090E